MASIGSVTRQISSLDISGKKTTTHGPQASSSSNRLAKQPSQNNVSKLLTKYAAPNPFANASNKPTYPSSLRNPVPSSGNLPSAGSSSTSLHKVQPATSTKAGQSVAQLSMDIGKYDGGLEIDNEKRGERVYGEAAEDLALDSSVSK